VYDETLERLVPAAERIRVGHGLDAGIQMGPLISQDHLDRVRGFIEDADLLPLTGGAQLGRVGFFLPPTIFSDVDMRSRMWREEIFGPVLCVVPFDDLDHAVEIANDSQYGLAAGIFSEDEARVSELASRLDVGTVWANTHNQFDPAAPWGGLKCSDVGKELGSHALDSYTEEKVVWRAG
jgi:acyl-CoA reductase-like NAD-dependent aldehyde dehydrogenase